MNNETTKRESRCFTCWNKIFLNYTMQAGCKEVRIMDRTVKTECCLPVWYLGIQEISSFFQVAEGDRFLKRIACSGVVSI